MSGVLSGIRLRAGARIWRREPLRALALAVGLVAVRVAARQRLTGFPGTNRHDARREPVALAQIASIVGLHGLTLGSVAISRCRRLWTESGSWRQFNLNDPRGAWRWPLRLRRGAARRPASATVASVKLRIMQPNVAQDAEFSPENGAAILSAISPFPIAQHRRRRRASPTSRI